MVNNGLNNFLENHPLGRILDRFSKTIDKLTAFPERRIRFNNQLNIGGDVNEILTRSIPETHNGADSTLPN